MFFRMERHTPCSTKAARSQKAGSSLSGLMSCIPSNWGLLPEFAIRWVVVCTLSPQVICSPLSGSYSIVEGTPISSQYGSKHELPTRNLQDFLVVFPTMDNVINNVQYLPFVSLGMFRLPAVQVLAITPNSRNTHPNLILLIHAKCLSS